MGLNFYLSADDHDVSIEKLLELVQKYEVKILGVYIEVTLPEELQRPVVGSALESYKVSVYNAFRFNPELTTVDPQSAEYAEIRAYGQYLEWLLPENVMQELHDARKAQERYYTELYNLSSAEGYVQNAIESGMAKNTEEELKSMADLLPELRNMMRCKSDC